ncbi:MAG: hypothetical protein JKX85_13090, partial [Phycisphaeraceae bacterium]|nr:hypothetical protein [Phycisphaeraceae bacterium]
LAQAKPLATLSGYPDGVEAYLYETQADGANSQVVIMWNNEKACQVKIPRGGVYDVIGREISEGKTELSLGQSPIYIVVRDTDLRTQLPHVPWARTKGVLKRQKENPCPVVMNYSLPDSSKDMVRTSVMLYSGQTKVLPVEVYNFSSKPVSGEINIQLSDGLVFLDKSMYKIKVDLEPLGLKTLMIPVHCKEKVNLSTFRKRPMAFTGNFGEAGMSYMKFNVMVIPSSNHPIRPLAMIEGYKSPDKWEDQIGPFSQLYKKLQGDWMTFRYIFGAPKDTVIDLAWAGPKLHLSDSARPSRSTQGMSFKLKGLNWETQHGQDFKFAVIVSQAGNGRFMSYFPTPPSEILESAEGATVLVSLPNMARPAFDKKRHQAHFTDTLDITKINGVSIVIWSKPYREVSVAVKDLQWVNFK